MTNTLPDFFGKTELSPLATVVGALQAAGGVSPDDFLLVSAAARDLWMRYERLQRPA